MLIPSVVRNVDFNLDTNLLGLNVAILNAGSIFGALSSGYICDKFGLRWAACISVFYTIVAVVLQTVSLNGKYRSPEKEAPL